MDFDRVPNDDLSFLLLPEPSPADKFPGVFIPAAPGVAVPEDDALDADACASLRKKGSIFDLLI